jgi:tRNA(adenine34) deaminase
MTDDELMRLALEEAAAALADGNEPYGAVIVRDGHTVTGRNECATANDPTAHSEVMAIRHAAARWGTRDLNGASMYTSFEPCPMCCGAIIQSGIRTVVIGARRSDTALGEYTVEKLLDLTGQMSSFTIRRDVLANEAQEFYARVSAS